MDRKLEVRDLRLRFVQTDAVLLHEESDPARVARLTSLVLADGFLRNPPIAAPLANGKWVVLDGATRTTMLRNLGAAHMLIQSVEYAEPHVTLEAWYHVLPSTAAIQAERFAGEHSADIVQVPSVQEARKLLDARKGIAAIVHEGGHCSVFSLPSVSYGSAFGVLRALVSVYGGAGEIYRIVHDDLVDIVRQAERCPEVVMFPAFTPQEIRQAATEQDVLPAGITRHLISGRSLNLNIEMPIVMSSDPLEHKNSWLANWLTTKILEKKVRYYHEPVFVFDD